jgi:DNA repair ATPase RecN
METKTTNGSEPEDLPDPKEYHELVVYMQRVDANMKIIRQQLTEAISYLRNAESEVPESLRRFANYMHDIHDIKYMYEEIGIAVPEHLLEEMRRVDDRYRQILNVMNTDGGPIEKIRREMASDPENRWDHTRLLTKRGEKS